MTRTVLFLMFASSAVRADQTVTSGTETILVIDHAPDPEHARDRERALGDAPFVTVIHPDDHPATASVADAIGTTVGAQVRSAGGAGAYESVVIRGASPGHTAVLIDGVPLSRIAAVTTDLSRFALASFGEVELYRGAVPVELGGAGVGGAVNLITRLGRGEHGERITASLGTGSFGARHLRVHYGDAHGAWLSSTTLGYQGATGDFTYYSDNGTQLYQGDDSYKKRTNAGYDQVDLSTRIGRAQTDDAGGLRLAYRDQGLPGSAYAPTLAPSLATLDAIGDARFDLNVGPALAKQLGYLLVERQQLRDPMGELGLGTQARDYVTLSGGASSTWRLAIDRHRATAGLELRGDRFRDADGDGSRAAQIGTRLGGAVLAAVDLALDPDAQLVLTPSFRLDVVRTKPADDADRARAEIVPSPRISLRAAISPVVSIKASAGYYVRLPTLIEMFGDRGDLLGNGALRPETGPSTDAGIVFAPEHAVLLPNGGLPEIAIDRVFVEAAGFATRPSNTIVLVPTAGTTVYRAVNVGDALTYGSELVGSLRVARTVSLTVNYTHLVTAQLDPDPAYFNKQLPSQPTDTVSGRLDVVRRAFSRDASVYVDVRWQAGTFLDRANLQPLPDRSLIGAGARVEIAPHLGVSLSVTNLANERTEQLALTPAPRPDLAMVPTPLSDVFGFPLPGRSYYLVLDWSHK
jgi:outer membrane cobalamin receptor